MLVAQVRCGCRLRRLPMRLGTTVEVPVKRIPSKVAVAIARSDGEPR